MWARCDAKLAAHHYDYLADGTRVRRTDLRELTPNGMFFWGKPTDKPLTAFRYVGVDCAIEDVPGVKKVGPLLFVDGYKLRIIDRMVLQDEWLTTQDNLLGIWWRFTYAFRRHRDIFLWRVFRTLVVWDLAESIGNEDIAVARTRRDILRKIKGVRRFVK